MRRTNLIHYVCAALTLFVAGCGQQSIGSEKIMTDMASSHLIIRFSVKSDRLDDFLPIMEDVSSSMASEDGFIAARVYRNVDDPLSFTLIEEWASRAAHQHHFDVINQSGDWGNILGMLTRDPDMSYNDVL